MQSEAKVHVTGNVYRHNPYTHFKGTTHLISQRLSLNIPRLNENQHWGRQYTRFQKKSVHFVFGDFPLPIMLNVHMRQLSAKRSPLLLKPRIRPVMMTNQRIETEPTAVAPNGNAVVPTANGQPDDVL